MALFGAALKRSQVRCDCEGEGCMDVASISFTGTRDSACTHGPAVLHLAFCKQHEDAYFDGLACAVCDAPLRLGAPIFLAVDLPNGKAR